MPTGGPWANKEADGYLYGKESLGSHGTAQGRRHARVGRNTTCWGRSGRAIRRKSYGISMVCAVAPLEGDKSFPRYCHSSSQLFEKIIYVFSND